MLETFTLDTFTPLLNSRFKFRYEPDGEVEMELIEAEDVGSTPKQMQFSIVFRGPRSVFLPQAIYAVEHEKLGAFKLFIVPIKQDQDSYHYQAVFNRQIK